LAIFCDKILFPRVRGFLQNEGVKRSPLKSFDFAAIGSPRVKTVTDKYKHVAYLNKHW